MYKIQAATDPEIPLRNKSRRVIAAREFAAESAKSRPPQIPLPPELQPPPFSQAAAGRPDHARSHAARCRLRKAKQAKQLPRAAHSPRNTRFAPRRPPSVTLEPAELQSQFTQFEPIRETLPLPGASSGGNCHGPAPALRPPAPPPRRAPGPPLP